MGSICRFKLPAPVLRETSELMRSRRQSEYDAGALPSHYYEPPQYYYSPPYITATPEVGVTLVHIGKGQGWFLYTIYITV